MRNPENVLKMQPLELWRLLFYSNYSFKTRSQHHIIIMGTAYSEGDCMPGIKLYTGTIRRGHWAGLVLSSGLGAEKGG